MLITPVPQFLMILKMQMLVTVIVYVEPIKKN
jgi:hypothetical protein